MSSIEQGSYTIRNLEGDDEGEHAYFRMWPENDMYIELTKKARYGEPVSFGISRPSDMNPGEFASRYLNELDSINPEAQVHFSDSGTEDMGYVDLASIGTSTRVGDRVIPSDNLISVLLLEEGVTWNEDIYGSAAICYHFDSLDEELTSFVTDEREDHDVQSIEPTMSELKQEVRSHSFDWRNPV